MIAQANPAEHLALERLDHARPFEAVAPRHLGGAVPAALVAAQPDGTEGSGAELPFESEAIADRHARP